MACFWSAKPPSPVQIRAAPPNLQGSIPGTWATLHSGDIGNSLEPNRLVRPLAVEAIHTDQTASAVGAHWRAASSAKPASAEFHDRRSDMASSRISGGCDA